MKLSLFVIVIALSLRASAQQADPLAHILDGIEVEAEKESKAADQDRAMRERAARFQVPLLATEAQKSLQPLNQKPCPTSVPPYSSVPFDEAGQNFRDTGFVGPQGGFPQVSYVDFSRAAPMATHEMNVTVLIESGSGWSAKETEDSLAKMARIYAQCGIRLAHATVVNGRSTKGAFTEKSEIAIAKAMPKDAPKPWLFFISQRSDNDSKDNAGTSISYTKGTGGKDIRGTGWIGRNSLTTDGKANIFAKAPELVVGHEVAHLLTDGDHQNARPNILNGDARLINAEITPDECAEMRANSALVHPIQK